jgi:polyferredoxin
MITKPNYRIVLVGLFFVFFLMSCLPGGGHYSPNEPAGFFSGIWHGWMAPFSLIWSLFNPSVTIYESFNTGWWYDFGFYISIIAGFGSLQLFRKKDKKS